MAFTFSHEWLGTFATDVFQAVGAPEAEAKIVAEHLVTASLLGYDTHGVVRIAQYVEDALTGSIKPGAEVTVNRTSATTAIVDGGWNFGQVVALRAIDVAIENARTERTATVVVKRCCHAGRLGTYTARAAEAGLLALGVCNSPIHGHFVAPWGGRQGRLATNPISYAIPCDGARPIVADFSTAEASEGAIRLHRNLGKPLPDGWIVDAAGKASNDPADFYGPPKGAIHPFGGPRGYRGFALGLLVEVLGGILGGSAITQTQPGNGLGFVVIDPSAFVSKERFGEMMLELRDYIKSAETAQGFDEVLLPGEPDCKVREERIRDGIPVDENSWRLIEQAVAKLGIMAPMTSGVTR